MKAISLTKKLDKLPNLMGIVHEAPDNKINHRRHCYCTLKHVIEYIETPDRDITGGIHIRRVGDISKPQSDYFAGYFYHTIKQAINYLTNK